MKKFFRDTITVESVGIETTDEGFLIVPARFTRAGVFEYSYGNVYRSPAEVGSYESIETLNGKSVTDLHPPKDINGEEIFVDPENWKKYEVGQVLSANYDYEDTVVRGRIIIKDKDTIERILSAKEKGESIELSCGHWSMLAKYEAVIDGKSVQYEQSGIIYNHVALVPKGRAGSNIKLMLDSMNNNPKEEKRMKLKIGEKSADGKKFFDAAMVEIDEKDESIISSLEKAIDSTCAEIEGLSAKLDAEKKKVKDMEDELKELKEKSVDVSEIEKIADRKNELRVICEGLKIEHKEKSIDEMENLIIADVMPKVELEGKPADYRSAIVDTALELAKESVKNNDKVKVGVVISDKPKEENKGFFESLNKGE